MASPKRRAKKVRRIMEWAIYKMTHPPDYWDGPFKSERAAMRVHREYEQDAPGDFRVAKQTTEFLEVLPRRSR